MPQRTDKEFKAATIRSKTKENYPQLKEFSAEKRILGRDTDTHKGFERCKADYLK